MTTLLEVKNIVAVKDVSLTVNKGEIVTLVGSNGAGKSTTLRTISGLLKPRTGEISFNGERIDGRPGHELWGLEFVTHLKEDESYDCSRKSGTWSFPSR